MLDLDNFLTKNYISFFVFRISFVDSKKPGELLIKHLDRSGCSLQQYRTLINTALNTKTIITYYQPFSKVAVLIANEKYEHLSKLATPSIDCDSLACNLRNLGFITVTVKNTKVGNLKDILKNIFQAIPEDSYCKYNIFDVLLAYNGTQL